MKLRDGDGHGVDLRVAGYQFPDAEDPHKRFSWHTVAGCASTADGTWDFEFAALCCDETPRVSSWIRDVHRGDSPAPLRFTEPNLAFSVANRSHDEVELRVALDLEFLPPWSRHVYAGDPTVVSIVVRRPDLARAADAWDQAAAPFPDST